LLTARDFFSAMKHTHRFSFLAALIPAALVACAAEDKIVDVVEPTPVAEPEPEPAPAPAPTPTPEPATCDDATASHTMTLAESNIVFLLDRSSSMHKSIGNGETRWTATKTGLFAILDTLPADVQGGLQVFPAGDAPRDCCSMRNDNTMDCSSCTDADKPDSAVRCDQSSYSTIPTGVAPLSPGHIDLIKSTVSADDELNYWGTPMAPALNGVIAGTTNGTVAGVTSVVLLTDGLPAACSAEAVPGANNIDRVLEAVAQGQSLGVRTFVVGIDAFGGKGDPDLSLATNLSPIAMAAGTARYGGCEQSDDCAYMVDVDNFEQSLDVALQQVALQATGCAFAMPQVTGGSADLDGSSVSVVIDGTLTDVARDVGHVSGWDALPGGQQLQLYGAACEMLKANPGATVEIVVSCDPG
jgi:hypothetical protein